MGVIKMNRCLIILVGVLYSISACADVCPEEGEAIVTTPYQMSMVCPAAIIVVKGERNPEKYETCLGDVPSAKEQLYYVTKDNRHVPLPTVNSLLPPGDSFRLRLWVVGDLNPENIKCNGKNVVSVGYWGGGNCISCGRTVNYVFGPDGELQKAELK